MEGAESDEEAESSDSCESNKHVLWRKLELDQPDVNCDEREISPFIEGTNGTPFNYFKRFVTDDLIADIVEQSNIYCMQKRGSLLNLMTSEFDVSRLLFPHGAHADAQCSRLLGKGNGIQASGKLICS